MTTKYVVTRDDREYVFNDLPDWVKEDSNYRVEKLSTVVPKEAVEAAIEDVEILQQIYLLDEAEIKDLKSRLENALELVEVIHEFTNRDHESLLEARGTLKLVADSCKKWLSPKE